MSIPASTPSSIQQHELSQGKPMQLQSRLSCTRRSKQAYGRVAQTCGQHAGIRSRGTQYETDPRNIVPVGRPHENDSDQCCRSDESASELISSCQSSASEQTKHQQMQSLRVRIGVNCNREINIMNSYREHPLHQLPSHRFRHLTTLYNFQVLGVGQNTVFRSQQILHDPSTVQRPIRMVPSPLLCRWQLCTAETCRMAVHWLVWDLEMELSTCARWLLVAERLISARGAEENEWTIRGRDQ